MANDKAFLTYNQQMRHLRESKKINCNGTVDKTVLCRSGYFNLVNGYKNPFVSGTGADGEHLYIKNTNIKHLNYVKGFDDELRIILLKYISKAEEEVRAFTTYKFDEVNGNGKCSWYQVEAYNPDCDVKKVIALISKAYGEISRSQSDYVKFYMDNHKNIPTWIMTKVITFSTFIDLVELSKDDVKQSLCKLYSIIDDKGYFYLNLARIPLSSLGRG